MLMPPRSLGLLLHKSPLFSIRKKASQITQIVPDVSNGPIVVEFPLRGEWVAVNTPGERVPSHGTDYLAQTYAIDLIAEDWNGRLFHFGNRLHYFFGTIPVEAYYAWSKPVFSPLTGIVANMGDDWPDRTKLNFFRDFANAFLPKPLIDDDLRPLIGNFVIIQSGLVVALLAHLKAGSIGVKIGQQVPLKKPIAAIGNSGNTTAPHLHLQFMDSIFPLTAKGVPWIFRSYERWDGNSWRKVQYGVPRNRERVRHCE